MALSGTINGTTANNKITAKITWSAVQDISGNFSTITATLTYSRTNSGYTTGGHWSGSLSIGSSVNTESSNYIKIEQNSNTEAITHTAKVAHAANGTLSVKISATGKITGTTLTSTTIGDTVTLDTIPRASSITSAAAVTLGNACDVRWTPNSNTFRYKLKFSLGNWSHTTDAIHPNKTSAYAYTGYTIPLELAEKITAKKEDNMTVTLTTYSDSGCKTSIGSNSKTFKVTVPENDETQPTVTMELVAISKLEGIYIQGQSNVQATLSAEAKLGADIKSYSMTADGVKYESPYLSDTLTKSGEMEISGCAVDSRGIPGYAKQTITVLPYYIPRLTGVAVYRCTSDGVAADNGEYLKIEATRDYAPVVADGEQKNFCTIQYRYKAENAQEYSKPVTILESDAEDNSVITEPLLNATFYKSNAYTVQIIAVDTVGQSVTVTEAIPSERVFRHKRAGGKGLGLGGYCEEDNLLEVHWNQRVHGNLRVEGGINMGDKSLVDLIYPVGSIYMSVTDSDPALLFGGTWERLKDRFLLAAGDTYAGGVTGGEATHQLTAAEMPEHQHTVRSMVQGYSGWDEMEINTRSIIHDRLGADYYSPTTPAEKLNVAYVYGGGTGGAGEGKSHNNMPPYLAVYMYKRTA